MDITSATIQLIDLSLGYVERGGPGSGHHGHRGRKGKKGGSARSRADGRSLAVEYGDKAVSIIDINRDGPRMVGDKESIYNAEVVPGEAIRIYGEAYTSKREKREFDLTFRVGDVARATTGQLAKRRSEIVKITSKRVTVQDQYGSNKRRTLYNFAFDNCFGDDIHVLPTWELKRQKGELSVKKGGAGSGNWGHRGRKGKRGGSASSKPAGGRAFIKTSRFNEEEEYSTLFEKPTGQSNKPKPGVTRDQMQRFFDRRDAVVAAFRFKYRGNVSLPEEVDTVLDDLGMSKLAKKSGGRIELRNPTTDEFYVFRRKVETNYLKTIFNKDEFKKNY